MISIACPLRLIFPCDFTSVLFSPLALFFFLNTDNKVNWTSLVAQTVKRLSTMWETGFDPWVGKIPWRRK